jgi:hypothetical protein
MTSLGFGNGYANSGFDLVHLKAIIENLMGQPPGTYSGALCHLGEHVFLVVRVSVSHFAVLCRFCPTAFAYAPSFNFRANMARFIF